MGKKKTADVRLDVTVEFRDDGRDLNEQAWDAVTDEHNIPAWDRNGEVVAIRNA